MFKLLSVDPANYDDAPREGVRRVIEKITNKKVPRNEKIDLSSVESIRMGTTVATNALLERKGERVAFLVTKGFKDILRIGQQARPDIFDLSVKKLGHLYETVYEIDERVTIESYSEDPDPKPIDIKSDSNLVLGESGETIRVLEKPNGEKVEAILREIWDSGIRSLAICLMHGYTFQEHEQFIADKARKIGFTDVSVSSEIQPMIKLVSRGNSTNADAYLSPITSRYIANFGQGFKGGLEEVGHKLLFMQSDGGLTSWSRFSGLKAILSGPAGGVIGYARTSHFSNTPVLGFDMGGTSTDVSRYDGHLEHIFETTTAEVTIQAPQLDINTVAAGGGSILSWKNSLFNVGPESASAHPGPACYRKGGPLTVTDANLFLGRIVIEHFPKIFGPDENEPLDYEITKSKFEELTDIINSDRRKEDQESKDLTSQEVAMGFLKVANEAMCRPIRTLTEAKGHEANKHILASFGGAGGQHACAVAENLGIKQVIIHKYSSVLSAFGMSLADVVVEVQHPESSTLTDKELPKLERRLEILGENASEQLIAQGFSKENIELEKYLNLKYKGTESFIMTKGPDFASEFIKQHKQEFGFSLERDIVVGDVRVRGVGKSYLQSDLLPDFSAKNFTSKNEDKKTVKIYFDEGWTDASVYAVEQLSPGQQVEGPAMILDNTQTIVVQPNAVATSLPNHIVIDVQNSRAKVDSKKINPIQLSVFGHRFMSIAEQMGQTLQKTSISTNIKERLDFSCAIFDPDGGLVANAPHIPVHLGSMSSAVAFQKQYWEEEGKKDISKALKPGDVLVANHPAYGGSHLPDITVITPVFSDSTNPEIIFWVASRGHHSDIGGITAGSMPPFSKEIWEEGAQIKAFKIVSNDHFDEKGLIRYLYEEPAKYPGCSGSRSLSDSLSDLKAQIAANNKGIKLIGALINEYSLEVVQLYMKGFQENAELSVRNLFKSVYKRFGAHLTAEDCIDDGTPIKLTVDIDLDTWDAIFDFTGTGPQVYGNLNAPKAVCYSAILYVLRSIISDDIPLNQGCLKPLIIKIPDGSLLSPSPDAATVGGNVETSQRITDVVLKAFQVMGASQGTCNNLTFGFMEKDEKGNFKGFGYYETIAGGAGAGEGWEGQSGVQVHMTNTRSTDPEVLENRYPCILREFSIREGSGGEGRYRGGDGVIRDIEFRRPIQVSILSERRAVSPFGICGGADGERGRNLWKKANGKVMNLGGKNTAQMHAGDHMIVMTPGGGGFGALGSSNETGPLRDRPKFVPRATGSFHERSATSAAL